MKTTTIQQVNIIPIPPIINSTDKVKDLLEIDDKTLSVIQKHYKESMEAAFLVGTLLKRKYKKKQKPKELIVVPIIHRFLTENRLFYLYAGIVLPCDFSYEAKISVMERQSYLHQCKPLISVDKRMYYTILQYSYNFTGLENFEFLIDVYMRKGKQNYYNLAMVLKSFQANIQIWKKSSLIHAAQRLQNPDSYKLKFQLFTDQCLKKVDQLDQSKFYLFGFIMYNYETQNLEQRTVGFSQGLLSLLGTDQDQFAEINLRCGQPYYSQGEVLINALIVSLLPLAQNNLIYDRTIVENVLISFDGFEIPYQEMRSYEMPEDCYELGYFEMGFGLIEYDVSINILQQLLTLRAKRYYQDKIKEFDFVPDENFEYSMNSQIFIEKFYPNAITKDYLRCRYKYLSENNNNNTQYNQVQVITTVSQEKVNSNETSNLYSVSQGSTFNNEQQYNQKSNNSINTSYQNYTDQNMQNNISLFNGNSLCGTTHSLGYSMIIESPIIQNAIDQPNQIQNQTFQSEQYQSIDTIMQIEPFQYLGSNQIY